jgi:phage-related protein
MANGGDVIFNFKGDDKQLQKTTSKATSTLKGLSKTIGKVALTGGVALGGMFVGMVTSSIKARGEIEQSLGGINKLFGKSASEVVKNSQKAYKTAGISANQYMVQATSFSASLLKGLNGDTEKAAKITDTAIKDMADNANTFGTSMESIQMAYQGFAKQNYTMLDNLKLGYGGTKSEMVKLVKESGVLGEASKDLTLKNFDQKVSFDQIILAINKTQQRLKITGTTAKEAGATLQGSVSALKASWNNLLSGMGSAKEVLESLKPVIQNVSRIAKEAIGAIWSELTGMISNALQPAFDWINKHKDALTYAAIAVGTLTAAIVAYIIQQNIMTIMVGGLNIVLGIYNTITGIATAVTTAFGAVIAFLTSPITLVILAIGALIAIGVLLVKNWDKVKAGLLSAFNNIKIGISNGVNAIKGFFGNMGNHISEKVNGIKGKLGEFGNKMKDLATQKIPQAIKNITTFFGQLPGKLWSLLTNAFNKFAQFCTNLANKAKEGAKVAVNAIKNGFTNLPGNMITIGKNVVKGIWNGIGNTAQWLFDKIKGFKDQVLNKFKSFFGIHSPSTLFRDQVGVFMAQGIGEGFTDEMSSVSKQMNKAMATVGLGDMFELSPTLNRTMSSSSNVNVQVINNMETDLLGNLVNNIKTYSNGAKNDYNYGMSY